jgi:beta-lactamase regulating signal transducer with metallopeptidase domain
MNTLALQHPAMAAIADNALLARLVGVSIELALLACAVGLLIRLLRLRAPRVRALLWLLVLAKPIVGLAIGTPLPVVRFHAQGVVGAMPVRPVETPLPVGFPAVQPGADARFTEAITPPPSMPEAIRPPVGPAREAAIGDWPQRRLPIGDLLAGVWLAGLTVFVTLTARGQVRVWTLRQSASKPPDALKRRFQSLAGEMGIRRAPSLKITEALSSPALVGLVHPVVLLPQWLADMADLRQLDWLLRHELMHRKSRDPVALVVRRLSEILFYFHPAVWWAGRKWEEAMELACDRALLRTDSDARAYAEQLYRVLESQSARRRPAPLGGGLFATRTQIGKRIAALLRDPLRSPARLSALTTIGLSVLALISWGAGVGLARANPDSPATERPESAPRTPGAANGKAVAAADSADGRGARKPNEGACCVMKRATG